MNRKLIFAAFVVALVAADKGDAPDAEAVKKELKKLEGSWMVVSQVRDGRKTPADTLVRVRLVFSADGTLRVYAGERLVQRSRVVVDPAKKTFDIVDTEKEVNGKKVKGESMYGIYEFVKGGRRICYCVGSAEDRPTEFTSTFGSGLYLESQARVKD